MDQSTYCEESKLKKYIMTLLVLVPNKAECTPSVRGRSPQSLFDSGDLTVTVHVCLYVQR